MAITQEVAVPSTNDDGAKKSIFSTIVGYIDTLRGT
jgi:hypothetical protein